MKKGKLEFLSLSKAIRALIQCQPCMKKSQLLFQLNFQPSLEYSITFRFEVPILLNKEKGININREKY